VSEPERLVRIQLSRPSGASDAISYPLYELVRGTSVGFDGTYASGDRELLTDVRGEPAMTPVLLVSGDYYATLGVLPARGRLLTAADDRASALPVAVISYSAWQRLFGGEPDLLSKTIRIEDVSFAIVGMATS
jgi:hypothetical protein